MTYLINNLDTVLNLLLQHIEITFISLGIAAIIALPIGWFLYYNRNFAGPVLGGLGILYTIPSIALIIILLPIFGLNKRSVIVALIIYCQIILIRNVLAGLDSIDPSILEASRGMGMNKWQIAWLIQFPLALPVILAGVRVAAVAAVAIATVGAKFGAGGLGTLLFDGIAQAGRIDKIVLGAALVGILALSINKFLLFLEKKFAPQIHEAAIEA